MVRFTEMHSRICARSEEHYESTIYNIFVSSVITIVGKEIA